MDRANALPIQLDMASVAYGTNLTKLPAKTFHKAVLQRTARFNILWLKPLPQKI